jgi:hypothetical protein
VVAVVDAARALGADIDTRWTLRRPAELAATLGQVFVRLALWTGGAASVLHLPGIGWIEGDEARKTLSDLTTEAARALATAARSREGRQRSSSRLSNSRQAMRYRSRDRECPDRAR